MAGITQTIPNYGAGGISEQPDQIKSPGQVKNVINAIPDVTYGLYKRPGAKRVEASNGGGALANVQTGGTWFHYFRDQTEGSYIGQVAANGRVRMWSCVDGSEKDVEYHEATETFDQNNLDHKSITTYLTASDTEDIQALTINDSTFLNHRGKDCKMLVDSTSPSPPTYERTSNVVKVTRASHGLEVGDNIEFKSSAITKAKFILTGVPDANTFQFSSTGSNVSAGNTTAEYTPLTDARPHEHFAFIEILRAENGRQYGLNLYSSDTPTDLKRATRVKISGDTLDTGGGSGQCKGIGTQVFNHAETFAGKGNMVGSDAANLTFRITALGQQGKVDSGDDENSYACAYNKEIILLHGGENWEKDDTTEVTLDSAAGGDANGNDAVYTVSVTEHETVSHKGTINGGVNGLIRPTPTPFDADTAVTIDSIIGGITDKLSGTGVTGVVIGNGIYLHSSSAFNIEALDQDLMRIMQSEVNDISKLPIQCKHGYIVKISNTRSSDEDDYYVKFVGENNLDGSGTWVECAKPGIPKSFDKATLPHELMRQANGKFLIRQYKWKDRTVGDDVTCPLPSFVDNKINKVLFFRNRMTFLTGENVVCSRPGTVDNPDFWNVTALTISATDPVDIACASLYPSDLFDGIEHAAGLICFSTNQQFLLSSDDTVFTPDTAKLRSISNHNYNKVVPPINTGLTTGFIDNSNKYSRFVEMSDVKRESELSLSEMSKLVPTLLSKDIDLLTNSRENNIILFGKTNSDEVIGLKYFRPGANLETSVLSWFRWKHTSPIKYHFCVEDEYFFLDTANFLQKINLVQADTDPSITQDDVNYLLHLDNYTQIEGGVYNPVNNITTFTDGSNSCEFTWQKDLTDVVTPNGDLVLIDNNTIIPRLGRYATCTVTSAGQTFTVPGDWSREIDSITITNEGSGYTSAPAVTITGGGGTTAEATAVVTGGKVTSINIINTGMNFTSAPTITIAAPSSGTTATATAAIHDGKYNIGYLYEYNVAFPRIYPTQPVSGQRNTITSDVNSKLTVHRIKLNFGKIGLYETTLTRVGKSTYTEVYESTDLDEYDASDAPYLEETIKDIPVYERNVNVDIELKSSHPAPATLRSMSWEGDWNQMHYRRV